MRRRSFTALAASVLFAQPLRAQLRSKSLRIGILTIQTQSSPPYAAFNERLRELGFIEGENLALEFIHPNSESSFGEAARELLGRNVDVIVTGGSEVGLRAAMNATDTLPIVMVAIDYDPVVHGYVASLARPGGNVTGPFAQQVELAAKRVQIVEEAFPDLRSATVFWNPASADQWREMQKVTGRLRLAGRELSASQVDYTAALGQLLNEQGGALIVTTTPVFFRDRAILAEVALRHGIPSMFGMREFVEAGGLLSYGVSTRVLFRRAADYVSRIANGSKPADLPVEQPTKFELAINLKTANALGLTIPPTLLARADEVIE